MYKRIFYLTRVHKTVPMHLLSLSFHLTYLLQKPPITQTTIGNQTQVVVVVVLAVAVVEPPSHLNILAVLLHPHLLISTVVDRVSRYRGITTLTCSVRRFWTNVGGQDGRLFYRYVIAVVRRTYLMSACHSNKAYVLFPFFTSPSKKLWITDTMFI